MPETPVAANLDEALDVEVNLFSKVTLNPVLVVNHFPELINLVIGKVAHLDIRADAGLSQNLLARRSPDAIDIL